VMRTMISVMSWPLSIELMMNSTVTDVNTRTVTANPTTGAVKREPIISLPNATSKKLNRLFKQFMYPLRFKCPMSTKRLQEMCAMPLLVLDRNKLPRNIKLKVDSSKQPMTSSNNVTLKVNASVRLNSRRMPGGITIWIMMLIASVMTSVVRTS
jgi:hypothetical protein